MVQLYSIVIKIKRHLTFFYYKNQLFFHFGKLDKINKKFVAFLTKMSWYFLDKKFTLW